jgi:peptidyl-prolyl cis-trans isomerase C
MSGHEDGSTTRPHRSRIRWVVAAVTLVLVAGAAVGVVLWRDRGLPDDAVFSLDGEVYDVADLQQYLREQRALYGLEDVDLSSDEDRRAAAQSFAVSLVVDEAVEEADVSVSEDELDRASAQFLEQAYPAGREAFVEALADEGVSEQDVLDELRRQLLIERLYASVTKELTLEPTQVRETYASNPEDFVLPETRQIAAIAVGDRAEAEALKVQLTPANFAAVARRRSLDRTTAADGGNLGYVSAQQLQGAFSAASFAARPGQVFGPVRASGASYVYLGLVLDVRPARTQSFTEVRKELGKTLLAARGLQTWQSYLSDRVAEASLEYAQRYRPEDPDSIPSFDLPDVEPSTAPDGSSGTGPSGRR